MELARAINKTELAELLAFNKLKSKEQLMHGKRYLFTVHEDTIWVDGIGRQSWNLSGIAEHERDKCGIIVAFGTWFGRGFEENPNNPGKYYCRKTTVKKVEILEIIGR